MLTGVLAESDGKVPTYSGFDVLPSLLLVRFAPREKLGYTWPSWVQGMKT
jgi:hypothetical protein